MRKIFFDSEIIGNFHAKHNLITLKITDGQMELDVPLYYRKMKDPPVQISLVDGELEMFLTQELIQEIGRNVKRYINVKEGRLRTNYHSLRLFINPLLYFLRGNTAKFVRFLRTKFGSFLSS